MTQTQDNGENAVGNMKAIETAIVNEEPDRLKSLLAGRTLDSLQKSYLIDLAKLNGSPEIADIVENAPVKP
ncbi:hypothetical protein [Alteromonas oceanisediminis]|uniref:hypothetical protein n=1 Tax=Alteromonas oceanisediminis TaxID=2836180 RepID=UPI001BDB3DEC|nr:hypothetical protein [Alteromonas oceanisediminis]MBT0587605.1 hypothetical protein [Alteromonas oceanisediminis]